MANPICATTCNSNLPVIDFSRCNPVIKLSEIRRIFIGKVSGVVFTNASLAAEWVTRLDESSIANDNIIRPLIVIGDKPAPQLVEKEISGGRKFNINKTHVINFTIDEMTAVNHAFLRQLECGNEFRMWYETAGGLLFGGNEGIFCRIKLDMVLARGDEHMVYNGTCEWKSLFTEEYVVSPIAAST